MNVSRMGAVIGVCMLGALLGGCCGGGETTKEIQQSTPINVQTKTVGDQLMDLQKAYESGAINEQEYKKMRQDIIDKSGQK